MVVMTPFAAAVNQLVPLHSQRVYNDSFFFLLLNTQQSLVSCAVTLLKCWPVSFSSFWENTNTLPNREHMIFRPETLVKKGLGPFF